LFRFFSAESTSPLSSAAIKLKVVEKTVKERPVNATHWSMRAMAEAMGISHTSVQRIWAEYGLKPHLVKSFKVSNDPDFAERVEDIVGLYLDSAAQTGPLMLSLPARRSPLQPHWCGYRYDRDLSRRNSSFSAKSAISSPPHKNVHNAISSTSLTVYLIAYLLLLRPASVAFPEGLFGQSHWSIPSEH
jgi:hypothetical protein